MIAPDWLWIPVTIAAAVAQSARNTAQRHLTPVLGTLGATLVRFLYGVPFALLFLWIVAAAGKWSVPPPNAPFAWWVVIGSVAQIGAMALLLRVMEERNFAIGIAYSKTEVIQIGVFGLVFLGDPLTTIMLFAMAVSTVGVMLLSPIDPQRPIRTLVSGWTTRTALLGILSGAGFGIASVGYRGAALALEGTPFPMAAAATLVAAQVLQTLLLGGWLLVRKAAVVLAVLREWRKSVFAGAMGATASAFWFTAFAIEPAANVRTLALIEILFGYVISRRIFSERFTRVELCGMLLLLVGLVIITLR